MGVVVGSDPHPTRPGCHLVTIAGLVRAPGWRFAVTVRRSPDGPRVLAIEKEAPEGQEITPKSERQVPVGEVIRLAKAQLTFPIVGLAAEELGIALAPRPKRGDPRHLRKVAALYRVALEQGAAPRAALREVYGVSGSTIERWLADCRDDEHPDPETGMPYLDEYLTERARALGEKDQPTDRREQEE